jgi:lysyl-tRNA synthetase class 2
VNPLKIGTVEDMRDIGVRVLAALPATVGTVDVAAGTLPRHQARVWRQAADLLAGAPLARLQALTLGLLLLVLAHGIASRRRLALHLGTAVLVLTVVIALPGHPVRLTVLGAAIVALAALRDEFITPPDSGRLRMAGLVVVGVLGLVLAGSGWDLAVKRDHPRAVGQSVLAGFTRSMPHTSLGPVLAVLVAAGGIVVLVLALAPAAAPPPGNARQRAWVAGLADDASADSLAPFATRRDKTYVFSPDRRAAIGYRVFFGTALAGGDPVGDPASAGAAVAEFLETCARNGWRPAVLGAGDSMLRHWRGHGMRGLVVGDEAILDPAAFSLASRRMRNVRQAVSRTRNAGVTVDIGTLNAERARTLRPVLDAWLSGRHERGFAMNLDQVLTPRADCLVAAAHLPSGEPVAFARFAVCAGGRVLTLDVAPRRGDAPNGVVERLIVEAVEHARTIGVREVSLNFAGMRRVFESTSRVGRLSTLVLRAFDPWIEIGPLYRFCAKFQPIWRPRSLLLASWSSLGVVGLAALVAEFRAVPAEEPRLVDGAPDQPAGTADQARQVDSIMSARS